MSIQELYPTYPFATVDGPEQTIDEDDFFRLNPEFRHWLKKKHKNFDDYDSREQRHKFRKFVRYWNNGELSDRYYSGKYSKPLAAAARSEHKWNVSTDRLALFTIHHLGRVQFADSITGDERQQLAAVKQDNDVDIGPALPERLQARKARQGPATPHPADLAEYRRTVDKHDRKTFRKRQKEDLEELVPRETGREAQLAKKRAARAARRERDVSPETDDKTLMGSGGDFQSVLRYRRAQKDARVEEKRAKANEKLSAFREKEAGKMAELRAMAEAARGSNSLWKT
eukprot:m.36037 g.36037  ORF g.36037 m.36037 type:complete len:285 (-) comp12441_c0_seq5:34-888(-)